ncbi:hypothetical protein B0J11DRAFT_540603 [Dendryphion nanum]|uniref:Uncharacterized protein n=1 Tax=Dendryphion nanum TaxID=256645 RepID=A0A9P9D808_9PLEO|nr:hypothetical protein B0J11DRAFT_540603 [Dendryphion nanum]
MHWWQVPIARSHFIFFCLQRTQASFICVIVMWCGVLSPAPGRAFTGCASPDFRLYDRPQSLRSKRFAMPKIAERQTVDSVS